MEKQLSKSDLEHIYKQAKRTDLEIQKFVKIINRLKGKMSSLINQYNSGRLEFIKEEMAECALYWCTMCQKVVPQVRLLLIEGKKMFSRGYQNEEYSYRAFSEIHHACLSCQKSALAKNGWQGEWDEVAKDREEYFAYHVKHERVLYYALKNGEWVPLTDNHYEGPTLTPTSEIIEQLAAEWQLLPKLDPLAMEEMSQN